MTRRSSYGPARMSSFVGREADLDRIARLVGRARLVSVIGPGGCGKTRLVTEAVGARLFAALGVVELASLRTGDPVAVAALTACGIRDEPGRAAAERLQDRLGSGVLVLDNCEHVRDEVAALVVDLLTRCPGLTVLATSRVALGVGGETVLPLTGLDPDGDGVALFLDRAHGVQPSLPPGPETAAAASRICRMVDGLPLAVELAAARARSLPLPDIATRIAGRLRFLSTRDPGALPQHRSLLASVGWSVELVDEPARRALAALAAIGGRFTLSAARAVTGVDDAVEVLVDHSLVQFDARDGRYLLLEVVREFATRELDPEPAAPARLAAWAADLASSAADALARADDAALRRVVRDDAAVRSVLGHAARSGTGLEQAARVVVDLAFAWFLRGRCREGLEWAGRIGSAMTEQPPALLWAEAFLSTYAGDLESGFALASSAAEAAAAAGDGWTRARALILVGMAQLFGDPAAADPVLVEAAALAAGAGDDWGHVEALQTLAYARAARTDLTGALECADAAAAALDRLDHPQLRAWDHAIRADVATAVGDLRDACRHGRAAMVTATGVGEPVSASGGLLPLVRALVRRGLGDEAALVVTGHREFQGSHPGLGSTEAIALAEALATPCTDPRAADRAELATTALAAGGMVALAAEGAVLLAGVRFARRELDAAADAADDAVAWSEAIGNKDAAWAARLVRCAVERASGATPSADAHQVLVDAAAAGLRPLVADALDLVAGLNADAGRLVLAARLHASSAALRRAIGAADSPLAASFRQADERAVTAGLDPAALAAARSEGARLSPDEAVALAMRSRGRRARPRSGWESLTPTERDVVVLAARGLSNEAIGAQLLSSAGTVRTHLRSVFGKLGVTSRAELAAAAARHGL